jgi:hypothetical protein
MEKSIFPMDTKNIKQVITGLVLVHLFWNIVYNFCDTVSLKLRLLNNVTCLRIIIFDCYLDNTKNSDPHRFYLSRNSPGSSSRYWNCRYCRVIVLVTIVNTYLICCQLMTVKMKIWMHIHSPASRLICLLILEKWVQVKYLDSQSFLLEAC